MQVEHLASSPKPSLEEGHKVMFPLQRGRAPRLHAQQRDSAQSAAKRLHLPRTACRSGARSRTKGTAPFPAPTTPAPPSQEQPPTDVEALQEKLSELSASEGTPAACPSVPPPAGLPPAASPQQGTPPPGAPLPPPPSDAGAHQSTAQQPSRSSSRRRRPPPRRSGGRRAATSLRCRRRQQGFQRCLRHLRRRSHQRRRRRFRRLLRRLRRPQRLPRPRRHLLLPTRRSSSCRRAFRRSLRRTRSITGSAWCAPLAPRP